MVVVCCTRCHLEYPAQGMPYLCPACGGVLDWDEWPGFSRVEGDEPAAGLWRYRPALGLPLDAPLVTLGEGDTPLIWDEVDGLPVGYKMESLNPSGSYKDRGSAVLLSLMLARGVHEAVEDSSGNAGASFAAYCARAGIKARVFVPSSASGPKRRQIEIYGADLVEVPGPRSAAAAAVRQAAQAGIVYASHAYLPFGMTGIATIAYELIDQVGQVPGTVIAPVGHGSLFLGIVRGFASLKAAGVIKTLPRYVGVQSAACAPFWAAFYHHDIPVTEGPTLAEGIRVLQPVRASALAAALDPGIDTVVAVQESDVLPARDELARRGIYVEPTSAVVWAAFKQLSKRLLGPVILIMSGSGYKFQN